MACIECIFKLLPGVVTKSIEDWCALCEEHPPVKFPPIPDHDERKMK